MLKRLESSVRICSEEKENEPELVPSTVDDLNELNVNQLLGHLHSTKNKKASNRIQNSILEGMYM